MYGFQVDPTMYDAASNTNIQRVRNMVNWSRLLYTHAMTEAQLPKHSNKFIYNITTQQKLMLLVLEDVP